MSSVSQETDANHLYAINIHTGEEVWSFSPAETPISARDTASCLVSSFSFYTNGHLGGLVTIGNGSAYWSSLNQQLYSLDAKSGELNWTTYTDLCANPGTVFVDNKILINNSGKLIAFDSETGNKRWEFAIDIDESSVVKMSKMTAPAAHEGSLYIGANDEHLYVLNAESGEEEWRYKTMGRVESPLSIARNTIFFGTNRCIDQDKDCGYLYAMDLQTREALWKMKVNPDGTNGSPVPFDKFVTFSANDGALHTLKLVD